VSCVIAGAIIPVYPQAGPFLRHLVRASTWARLLQGEWCELHVAHCYNLHMSACKAMLRSSVPVHCTISERASCWEVGEPRTGADVHAEVHLHGSTVF
jgi:hypothetical protein